MLHAKSSLRPLVLISLLYMQLLRRVVARNPKQTLAMILMMNKALKRVTAALNNMLRTLQTQSWKAFCWMNVSFLQNQMIAKLNNLLRALQT